VNDRELIETIERICGDDFCEDMEMRFAADENGDLPGDLKTAIEKLSLIYRMTHSAGRDHTCFRVHEDWRKEAELVRDRMLQQEASQ
jgi:hypothetical protein